MTDKEKDQEIWRTYPDHPFIEVNQFGEIRTKDRIIKCSDGRKRFVKGRMLKQYLAKDGYMRVHFGVNGKTVNLLVHRIIATCFLPNPNNLPEVNHKDNLVCIFMFHDLRILGFSYGVIKWLGL